jgi:hypothetical protein
VVTNLANRCSSPQGASACHTCYGVNSDCWSSFWLTHAAQGVYSNPVPLLPDFITKTTQPHTDQKWLIRWSHCNSSLQPNRLRTQTSNARGNWTMAESQGVLRVGRLKQIWAPALLLRSRRLLFPESKPNSYWTNNDQFAWCTWWGTVQRIAAISLMKSPPHGIAVTAPPGVRRRLSLLGSRVSDTELPPPPRTS